MNFPTLLNFNKNNIENHFQLHCRFSRTSPAPKLDRVPPLQDDPSSLSIELYVAAFVHNFPVFYLINE